VWIARPWLAENHRASYVIGQSRVVRVAVVLHGDRSLGLVVPPLEEPIRISEPVAMDE
jgi:hypothetical protein